MLTHEIAAVLERKIGLGEFPLVARRFFSRLQRHAEQHGDRVLYIIAGVLEESQGGKIANRNKYFGWVVKRRLDEQGYPLLGHDGGARSPNQTAAVRDIVAKVATPPVAPAAETMASELERERARSATLAIMLKREQQKNERGAF